MPRNKSWEEVRRESEVNEELAAAYGALGTAEERLYAACHRRGISDRALGAAMGVDESAAWEIDTGDALYILDLAKRVGAAGGRLEVRAVFDDEEVLLLRAPLEPGAAE